VTHEYVIALGGIVLGAGPEDAPTPTAIGWAADRVLAVGPDDVVRTISRGDSTFIHLRGCAVTPAPADPVAAEQVLRHAVAAGQPFDTVILLRQAGLLDPADGLEPGAPAELAFWSAPPERLPAGSAETLRIVATVHGGAFTEGEEHHGPFDEASGSAPRTKRKR
jgi:hypothetical protein